MLNDAVAAAARNAAIRSKALREAEEFVRARLWRLEDATAAELGQLYTTAYQEMSAQLAGIFGRYVGTETWRASDQLFRLRTEALLSGIAADVARLTDAVAAATLDSAIRGYRAALYGRGWVLEQGFRSGRLASIPLLPVEAIRAQILAPYLGSTFLDRFADAREEFVRRIRRAMVTSQINGDGMAGAVRRLAQELGIGKGPNRRLGFIARLDMIARTEILRASNLGALVVYEANADVLKGWEWFATKDERTCPICGALDGQVFDFKALQSPPPGHPQCRCSAAPVLIDSALEAAIVGKRQTYREWALERGITIREDGGVLTFQRGA